MLRCSATLLSWPERRTPRLYALTSHASIGFALVLLLAFAPASDAAAQAPEASGDTSADAAAEVEALRALLNRLDRRYSPERERAEAAAAEAAAAAQAAAAARSAAATPAPPAAPALEQAAAERAALEQRILRLEAELAAARNESKAATDTANEAKHAADAYAQRYARTGPLIGAAFVYAPEDFDVSGDVDSSFGGAGYIGYRIHRHVAVELRYERFRGFDFDVADATVEGGTVFTGDLRGELEAYAITAAVKIYPLAGSFQPFVGLGVGALDAKLRGTRSLPGAQADGDRVRDSATESVFRPAAGIDFFLSENLVLNLEAAFLFPSGELNITRFGSLSSGVTFRF